MAWPFPDYAQRARDVERIDSHDITDEELHALFNFSDAVGRYLGGHSIVTNFLARASRLWTGPVTVLDLGCGRGALGRAIVDWAHRRRLDVKVHGSDKYGRVVDMARERHRGVADLTFETRDLFDPFFLQARQFDYVVGLNALHRESDERASLYLKSANRLARRGLMVVDWLRDPRAAFYLSTLARFSRETAVRDEMRLAVKRGFTMTEAERLKAVAGLDFAALRMHFGYRFSVAGERGLVEAPLMSPMTGLAGA